MVVLLALSSGGDKETCISYLPGLESSVAADFFLHGQIDEGRPQ